MRDKGIENATEAVGLDGTHGSIILAASSKSGPTEPTNDIDDRKTPLVFGRLWRELVSVFTLAVSPGLNVCISVSEDLMC